MALFARFENKDGAAGGLPAGVVENANAELDLLGCGVVAPLADGAAPNKLGGFDVGVLLAAPPKRLPAGFFCSPPDEAGVFWGF